MFSWVYKYVCVCHKLLSLCSSGILTSAGAAEAFLLEREIQYVTFLMPFAIPLIPFFLCLSLVGFPHMAQPSQQLPVPLSLTLSLCEDGDMLGGSPAV